MEKSFAGTIIELERELKSSHKTGLSAEQARKLLLHHGKNSLDFEKPPSPFSILWRQFTNIFVLILIIASIIALYSEGLDQAIVLWVIIVLNIFLGFLQENKAERALQALKDSVTQKAIVIRDGHQFEVKSEELVPGDLIIFSEGDQIPADIRLVETHNLQINQAILTGESTPALKTEQAATGDISLLEARNLAFSGTSVILGRGRGLVFATGGNCQFGKIADLVSKKRSVTPLEKRLRYLGKYLTILSIILAALLFLLGLWRHWPILKLLTYTMAILVSIVPESLPTTITLALAIGVIRMAKRKAVVRRLNSVETLGIVNVIATDKTGTLTKNQLSLAEVTIPVRNKSSKKISWQGVSLVDDQILSQSEEESIADFLAKSLLCTDATIVGNQESGDPTEIAILRGAKDFNLKPDEEKNRNKRLAEFPFDSAKGFMATLHQTKTNRLLIAKGTPEKIFHFSLLSDKQKTFFEHQVKKMSKKGMRVLAVAERRISGLEESSLRNLEVIGLLGLVDLPSESAAESIKRSIEAGIKPLIITGDNPLTAAYIGRSIGMEIHNNEIVLGHQIERLTLEELMKVAHRTKIFARVGPEDKIRIVEALKRGGATVAVTGDGVNDAPALREADVGVAMGLRGTAVAREAADVILLDNNYGTIIEAVRFGRAIYDNIKKTIVFLLSGNFSELFIVALAFVANLPVPITAIQILWVNLVTDALPAMAFAFEPPEHDVLSRGPGDNRKKIITHLIKYSLVLVLLSAPAVIFTYLYYLKHDPDLVSTMVLSVMIFIELVYAISVHTSRPFWNNIRGTFSNIYLWLAIISSAAIQIICIETPVGNFLNLKNITISDYGFLGVLTLVTFLLAEIIKAFLGINRKTNQSKLL
jgi:Ca2+-transporting ATPase